MPDESTPTERYFPRQLELFKAPEREDRPSVLPERAPRSEYSETLEAEAQAYLAREVEAIKEESEVQEEARALGKGQMLVILGEPGVGKTQLMRQWAGHLAAEFLGPVKQPVPLPLYGECRFFNASVGDLLRGHGNEGMPEIFTAPRAVTAQGTPILFLDGLDELPGRVGDFVSSLNTYYDTHAVVISCRTAIWQQTYEAKLKEGNWSRSVYRILGFKPEIQREYLRYHLSQGADELYGALQANAQLRALATSPLMLSLMVQVRQEELKSGQQKLSLPNSRAEFYSVALEVMWDRKPREERIDYKISR